MFGYRLTFESARGRYLHHRTAAHQGYDAAQLTIEMALEHTTGLPDDGLTRCGLGPSALEEYFATRAGVAKRAD